jgi:hypothetical protein
MKYDVREEGKGLPTSFSRNASGEGFVKSSPMPLGKCEENPKGGDSGNNKHGKY